MEKEYKLGALIATQGLDRKAFFEYAANVVPSLIKKFDKVAVVGTKKGVEYNVILCLNKLKKHATGRTDLGGKPSDSAGVEGVK